MADSGVDNEKIARLAKMAEAARLGGKGSIRRKHAPVHKTSSAQDDKRHSGGERALQQEQQRPVSKASTAQARVSITLQEAFSGGSKTLSFQRSRPCVTCSGKGFIRDAPDCMRCNGDGVTVATVQVMMGLHQQVQMKCAACAGTGAEGCRARACGGCNGRKTTAEVAHVQYYIKPGTVDGGVCRVRGEGSCDPGEEPGDIQIKISVQKHAEYSLKGSDLVCTHRVALAELLQGNLVIHHKHIDGNVYKLIAPVSPAPKPGSVYIATGLGMSIPSSPKRGCLAIVIDVVFPEATPALAQIASILHAACGSSERFAGLTGEEEEVVSRPVSELEMQEQFGRILGGGAGSSATQEDEEQEGGHRGAAGGAGCPLQ